MNARRHSAGMWLGIALMLAPVCLVQAQTKKKQTKADPFLTGPPWTFEEVLRGVGALFPARLEAAVEARGVDFFPTEAEEKQLRQAGAPETLIELIEKKGASYKPPPPPKPVTAGVLTLTCAPVECNIEINGKPAGFTKAGVRRFVCKHLTGNPASARVIQKLGFKYVGDSTGWCEARQCELPALTYERRRPWTMTIRALAS